MSTSKMLTAAETWEKVYRGFEQINFTAYDFDTVKQSLLDYLKLEYPENFNDYIESSQMIAMLELFSYVAELLAYRIDMSIHENELHDAQRKQSILRLAKLISYDASRNLPLRGLVKLTSITTSEDVRDSQGNSLSNRAIKWGDSNNPLWKEQFFLVINKILTQSFGNPFKSFQIDDTVFQQYEAKNILETDSSKSSFKNGVLKFKSNVNGRDLNFEIVPSDIDDVGVLERSPNPNAYFTLLYGDDGRGDASDFTGFMMYIKEGNLNSLRYVFDIALPNRTLDINLKGINNVDVWVQELTTRGTIASEWEKVPTITGLNLAFNTIASRTKYEVETLENDYVRLIFGDGDFAAIPTGIFNIWVRQSNSGGLTIPKNQIVNQASTFAYTSKTGKQESVTLTYSLTSALTNSAESESIEHIRSAAPAVYYSQNRMVNGEDYNSFFLKDPSILRLRAVNRTFAGQPKYLNWNDASGTYQNVKLFGNDLRLFYDVTSQAEVSQISSRSLIDKVIEKGLSLPGISNLISYAFYTASSPLNKAFINPRTKFIEDSTQSYNGFALQEKTSIQGALDRHWYGEPDSTVLLDKDLSDSSSLAKTLYGIVNSDTDNRIYNYSMKIVLKDPLTGVYTRVNIPGNASGFQETISRQKRFGIGFNPNRNFISQLVITDKNDDLTDINTFDNFPYTNIDQAKAKAEDYTIEITDTEGNFSVYGSLSGALKAGKIGTVYDNGMISFIIGFPPGVTDIISVGDAWILSITGTSSNFTAEISKRNLTGVFFVIDEFLLPIDADKQEFDVTEPSKSWLFLIERTDDDSGNVSYWTIITRSLNLITQSSTTKFWYDDTNYIVDPTTKLRVFDQVRVLRSNLNSSRDRAIGIDYIYKVIDNVKFSNGEVDYNSLKTTPGNSLDPSSLASQAFTSSNGAILNPLEFLRFIGTTDYVYFSVGNLTGNLTPVVATSYIAGLDYIDDVSEDKKYVRRHGRSDLDFMWLHYAPNDHVIDPSPSNIIDVYVLTNGYYSSMREYLQGIRTQEPTPPTPLELRNSYRDLIKSKMISDTVVMHSGRIKYLFGALAEPELRAKFRVVKSPTAKLTGDQIRSTILNLIDGYFSIDNWDFGQEFYATELCAVIHANLSTEISSVIIVPEFPGNYFGDLFHLKSGPDEIFMSAAKLENIELITSLDRITLKQRS